jgi:hypothetical protein
MKKEDLINYTKDELDEMFVNLINEMEQKGNKYMEYYNNSRDKDFDIDNYTYGAGLLTQVNRVRAMISLKNSKQIIN